MREVKTTCPYCGVGCGIVAKVGDQGAVSIAGDPEHPANFGRLCQKGALLAETLDYRERLLHPEVGGQVVDWDTALDAVAGGFRRVIEGHGPDAVAFYLSGQLLTEDYYVANKLMKGFIGSANVDTNSRLCMASAVAAHKRAFGADAVPCSYEDIERTKLAVLVGSNAAWTHPVLYGRLARARERNPDLFVVVIDPRRTATCDLADLHLAIEPGSDAWLFNGLLVHLAETGETDAAFVSAHTEGMEAALAAARESAPDIATVAARCALEPERIARFYRLFARTERTLTLFSQGVNQSTSGSDKGSAIVNCHLLTGRIGRPGMGPFSLTGQPNAMGGREVGGLANQLAAHMELDDAAARQRVRVFWQAPTIPEQPGKKAVDLFRAIETGEIKAVWIMATNPAVSLPEAERVREALRRCELVVVSDCVRHSDTVDLAHIRLPARAWGEKEGTVTNSERRISRQRAFLPPPGTAQPDWWMVAQVGRRLGFPEAFAYEGPAAIFREHAALSGLENHGQRIFDIGLLSTLPDDAYDALRPVQWPVTGTARSGTPRLFADGRFPTPSGRARLEPVVPRGPAQLPDTAYPFTLNSGRLRVHWHTMTRTGLSPRLARQAPEPVVEVAPADAGRLSLQDGDIAEVTGRHGTARLRVRLDPGLRPGHLFVPMHWSGQFAARARANALVAGHRDPVSGQPESKQTPVRIAPWRPAWSALLVSRRRLPVEEDYWAVHRGSGCWVHAVSGAQRPEEWPLRARGLLCSPAQDVGWVEYLDGAAYRAARLVAGRLESCLFVRSGGGGFDSGWLEHLFEKDALTVAERAALLSGRPPADTIRSGPPDRTVCACGGVGERSILDAVHSRGAATVEALGELLGAGRGCGACLPELRSLLGRIRA